MSFRETAGSVVKSAPGVGAAWWLWVVHHEAAWWVSVLTIVYIASQLFWGWWRFVRRGK